MGVTVGTALYDLFPTYWKHWWVTFQLWVQGQDPFGNLSFWVLPATILFDLCLIFKLIASWGMFRLRSWGKTAAIYLLSADFLFRLAGFINVQTYYWRHPERFQPDLELLSEVKSMPSHYEMITVSYIPSYIIGLLSLLSVFILLNGSVRKAFKKISVVDPDLVKL